MRGVDRACAVEVRAMRRAQSFVILAVLVLAMCAGVLTAANPQPARYEDASTTFEQVEPRVPMGEWRR